MVAIKLGLRALVLLIPALISPIVVIASELSLEVRTDQGAPLEHAAIALLPAQPRPESSAPLGDQPDPPEALMDQQDRQFSPYVLSVTTDTMVRFPNGDNIRHHVYSFSPAKRFELRLYHGSSAEPVRFDQAGTVVLGCNIHDAMLAYIYVVDSIWHGVTNAAGQLRLADVPQGDYTLQVQHPRLEQPYTRPLIIGAETDMSELLEITGLGLDPRGERQGDKESSDLQRLFDR